MSYNLVLGDTQPLTVTLLAYGGGPYVLDIGTDVVTIRYLDPDKETHEAEMTIVTEATGEISRTWEEDDLPSAGTYFGQVTVTRTVDAVVSINTFPDDGSKIIWNVYAKI